MRKRLLAIVLPIALAGATAFADGDQPGAAPAPAAATAMDVVVLKDGRRLEGEIVAEDDRFMSVRSGGVTRAYAKDSIASVQRAPRAGGSATPGAAPLQPSAPAPEPAGKGKKGNKGDKRDAPLSDAAKKWLDDLIARSAEADDVVRRSIVAAIDALGPQAVPAVRAAQAAAAEGPQKQFLDRLAGELEQRGNRRMRGGDGLGPDAPMPGDGPPGRGPGGRRFLEETIQRIATELELKDDQKPKVEGILQDAFKKRAEIGRDARRDGLSAEQVAERVTAARTDALGQMKTVLTEPQYAMFEQMAQRLFDAQRGPPMPPKPPEPPEPPKPDDAAKPADPTMQPQEPPK